jgi:hypothetical protein
VGEGSLTPEKVRAAFLAAREAGQDGLFEVDRKGLSVDAFL